MFKLKFIALILIIAVVAPAFADERESNIFDSVKGWFSSSNKNEETKKPNQQVTSAVKVNAKAPTPKPTGAPQANAPTPKPTGAPQANAPTPKPTGSPAQQKPSTPQAKAPTPKPTSPPQQKPVASVANAASNALSKTTGSTDNGLKGTPSGVSNPAPDKSHTLATATVLQPNRKAPSFLEEESSDNDALTMKKSSGHDDDDAFIQSDLYANIENDVDALLQQHLSNDDNAFLQL